MIEALVGVVVGVLIIVLARILRTQRWWYSVGLLVLPTLYASFAFFSGDHSAALKEMLVGIPFLATGLIFTLVSTRYSALVVGAFWILHGLFDLLHGSLLVNPGVPTWYPVWCCAIDVVVGSYLLWLWWRIPGEAHS
jgi:uncharacterized membrane protein HdeD (DUF308 family)